VSERVKIGRFWQCITSESFRVEVPSETTAGQTYIVRFGRANGSDLKDWSCTCKAHEFRKPFAHCKHIKVVKASFCGWEQITDGGRPQEREGYHACPRCGSLAEEREWEV
jgi:hypothetical protein